MPLFETGESVRISHGPFDDSIGAIDEVDYETKWLKVSVLIFGKITPAEFDFDQVELG
ncbi:transcription antitermination factor NusG [Kitasatospora sp. GAS204A]|uniref:hypothetical protein n=1 Tax=unclassified Kitasatospora TaxID=2633591 RepID=UPI0024735EB8|nr:hypothetical protein [Kitasatospora sp. GAS204B]MDH6123057.1 transcription antitermination factor NusG [Kitasatospora sp. GAS204B]